MPRSTTRRKRLKRLRVVEAQTGPDNSETIHVLDNGWTIRRLTTTSDEHREGLLMRHCLKPDDSTGKLVAALHDDIFSLRDPDNHPRATIGEDPLVGRMLAHGPAHTPPPPVHVARIREWHPDAQPR